MIEIIYEKVGLELNLDGWEEMQSTVSSDYTKAVWKKQGEVGDWNFCMEFDKSKDSSKVLCAMQLNIGKSVGSKTHTPIYVLDVIGVRDTIETLKKAIVLLIHRTMKGGMICQNL